MHNHFDNHLKLRDLMVEKRPKLVVECGAGNGDLTKLIVHMKYNYPFEYHVISDNKVDGLDDSKIVWHVGLSYNELPKFDDNSIDLCIIDTDHNYWTLTQELMSVRTKIKEGGFIAFHDVDEFYHNTGMCVNYWTEELYPREDIMKYCQFGGVGDALIEFLHKFKHEFKLVKWTSEKAGAALIEKKLCSETALIVPAGAPVFAKPVPEDIASAIMEAGKGLK